MAEERRAVDRHVRVLRDDVVGETERDESGAEAFGFVWVRGRGLDVRDPESLYELLRWSTMRCGTIEGGGKDAR